MTLHLSARLTWHDAGWDGTVCSDPLGNASCVVHDHIRDSRNDEAEAAHAGRRLSEVDVEQFRPPCSRDPGAYSATGYTIAHHDPLEFRGLPSVTEDLPPYSFATSPYGRMFSETGGWEYEPKLQIDRLKEFFGELEPRKSLVFFYLKDGQPFLDTNQRIIAGIGRIQKIGSQQEFGKTAKYPDTYPVWSRAITQDFPAQGFRLPLQEYARGGWPAEDVLCLVPESLTASFSYVAEHVSDDAAITIVERIMDATRHVRDEGHVAGAWDQHLAWLESVLGEVWTDRGAYPGIAAVLGYLGVKTATTFQRNVLSQVRAGGSDPWLAVLAMLEGRATAPAGHTAGLLKAGDRWKGEPKSRQELLAMLARADLSQSQVERVVHPTKRAEAGMPVTDEGLLANPYLIAELDRGADDSERIGFGQIDHVLLPPPAVASDHAPIDNDDDRRVRALLADALAEAAHEGDTLLPLANACSRAERMLANDRRVTPDPVRLQSASEFYSERLRLGLSGAQSFLALRSLAEDEDSVRERFERMATKTHPQSPIDWAPILDRVLSGSPSSPDENAARHEKADALDASFRSRLSVITGKAGTGKTTVARALVDGIHQADGKTSVLLLAPTGKARIRLQQSAGRDAKTIHQFLAELGWIEFSTFALKRDGGQQQSADTILIDEASMIPIDLLAALFRAIDFNGVKRLILMGDPNQLPPIGPGRPFSDLISWLDADESRRSRLVRLTLRGRFESAHSLGLRLSDGYTDGNAPVDDDEPISRIARNDLSGTDVDVRFWSDASDLHRQLDEAVVATVLGGTASRDALDASFSRDGKRSPEQWQILSPLRRLPIGTDELNRRVQLTFRRDTLERAKRGGFMGKHKVARPAGDHQIVSGDKIIQLKNGRRYCWSEDTRINDRRYLANGEIGLVIWSEGGRSGDYLKVVFGTQPGMRYEFRKGEVDENLDLAYAITVHKSQGSDFETVFLVLPQAAGTMSRELLYTALTRFRRRLVLLIEKDTRPLERFRSPEMSETMRRNTNLFGLSVRPEGVAVPFPERLIHRTTHGELVRSKSEVVVADVLTSLGISFDYELRLESRKDPSDFRLPDFTVRYEGETWYWEHLGMLSTPSYAEGWARKKEWYELNGYLDRVVTSEDGPDGSIDAAAIEKTARQRIVV
jgi:exodeoxyribonuclease V alpha subunit